VRLSFPIYARLENPPLSEREIQFKQGQAIPAIAKRSELESDSLAGSAAFESRVDQWSEASQRNATDDEYDLAEMDEDHSPMFDDGLEGWREPRG
jgi:hypothetical protein